MVYVCVVCKNVNIWEHVTLHLFSGQKRTSSVLLYPSLAFSLETGSLTKAWAMLAANSPVWEKASVKMSFIGADVI